MSYRKNIYWIEENSYSSENQLKNFDQILKKAKQRKLRLQVIRGSIMVISLVSLFLVWRLIDPYGQTGGVNDSINELNQNKVMLGVKDSILSLNQTHSKKSLQDSGQRMDMVNGSSEVGMEKSINKEKQKRMVLPYPIKIGKKWSVDSKTYLIQEFVKLIRI